MEEQERIDLYKAIEELGEEFEKLPSVVRKSIIKAYEEIRRREKNIALGQALIRDNRINHYTIQTATGMSPHTLTNNRYIDSLIKKHSTKEKEKVDKQISSQDFETVRDERDYYFGLWEDFSKQRLCLESALLVIEKLRDNIVELEKQNKALEIVNASRVVDEVVQSINQEMGNNGIIVSDSLKNKMKS